MQIILHDLDTLRARSRDLVRNNGFARGLIRNVVNQVVGTGFMPQSVVEHEETPFTETQAQTFRRRSERLWRRWTKFADANRRQDFNGLLATIFASTIGRRRLLRAAAPNPARPVPAALALARGDRGAQGQHAGSR
jgi:capsid protein